MLVDLYHLCTQDPPQFNIRRPPPKKPPSPAPQTYDQVPQQPEVVPSPTLQPKPTNVATTTTEQGHWNPFAQSQWVTFSSPSPAMERKSMSVPSFPVSSPIRAQKVGFLIYVVLK